MKNDKEDKKYFFLNRGISRRKTLTSRYKRAQLIFFAGFLFLLLIAPVYAMLNPSAVYCSALGYNYIIEKKSEGDWGYCILPNGTKVDSWLFLEGKTGISDNYCSKQGLKTKTIVDPDKCITFLTDECAMCLLANGTEIEVTELMGLTFNESFCGDGACGMPENNKTCPQDCPSGEIDEYCDGVADKICDPDCNPGEDTDCVPGEDIDNSTKGFNLPYIPSFVLASLLVVGMLGIVVFFRRRKKRKNNC